MNRQRVLREHGAREEDVEERGHEAAAVVPEEGRRGDGGEGHDEQERGEADRPEAAPEEGLRRRVRTVEEGRLVVDEVDVEAAPVEQGPGSQKVGRLVRDRRGRDEGRTHEGARRDEGGHDRETAAAAQRSALSRKYRSMRFRRTPASWGPCRTSLAGSIPTGKL